MRKGNVYYNNILCGTIIEDDDGYTFTYDEDYLLNPKSKSISLTMPITKKTYTSNILFSFFDGLIPEGWVLEKAINKWGISIKDRMGLLLAVCNDTIGSVSVKEVM